VEACGICHTDAATVTGTYPGLKLPRVPGHEVVGRIDAFGSGVSRWKTGQRVGIGFFGGEDGTCEPCRRGDIVNCQNAVTPGVTVDGGYAEVMIAEARGIASIPDELTSVGGTQALPGNCTSTGAIARQPFAVIITGLASIAGTWDKNDHGQRRQPPRNRYPPRPLTPRARLRS